MTKIENIREGESALEFLKFEDKRRSQFVSTTGDVAEGLLTFGEKLKICGRPYVKSDGTTAEALCFICTDSKGTQHGISAASFLARSPIYVRDQKNISQWNPINCENCGPDTMSYQDLWDKILSKKKVYLHRVVGKRGFSRERAFEYFTVED